MRVLNRSAIVLRPKAPYLQWAASLDEDTGDSVHGLHERVSIYLVPEDPTEQEETPPVELFFRSIFESELTAWTEDETEWPVVRDFATFLEWFDVARESVVADLAHGELLTEDL